MQQKSDIPAPRTIDEYLNPLSEKQQEALCTLWEIIKTIVPEAEEVISYQVPVFKYHGSLVGFAAAKKHLSFYVMSTTLLADYKEELRDFDHEGSTIRFTIEKQLPTALIEKIVRKRMEMNEEKAKAKQKK